MRPFISRRWTARLTVAFISVLQAKEAFTSGGGEITQTNEFVQVSFATARKIPMRGDGGRYAKSINEWEKATTPIAVTVTTAIETNVLGNYRSKLSLVGNSFASNTLSRLDTEGVIPHGHAASGPFVIKVPLDLFPDQSINCNARFVVQTRPSKALVREFSLAVQAAALATEGRTPPPPRQLTTYWLIYSAYKSMAVIYLP